MNLVKAFTELNWDICFKDLAMRMGWRSPVAQKNGQGVQRSSQVLAIVFGVFPRYIAGVGIAICKGVSTGKPAANSCWLSRKFCTHSMSKIPNLFLSIWDDNQICPGHNDFPYGCAPKQLSARQICKVYDTGAISRSKSPQLSKVGNIQGCPGWGHASRIVNFHEHTHISVQIWMPF